MNLRNISIIIRREYLNKVKKKSFLIITFVVPVLFAALCVVPSLIMLNTKEAAKDIAVVDQSGIVMPYLENTENIKYMDFTPMGVDSVKSYIHQFDVDAVLSISPLDTVLKTISSEIFSDTVKGLVKKEKELEEALKSLLGISAKVHLMEPGSIERSTGKAVRVIDKRKLID